MTILGDLLGGVIDVVDDALDETIKTILGD